MDLFDSMSINLLLLYSLHPGDLGSTFCCFQFLKTGFPWPTLNKALVILNPRTYSSLILNGTITYFLYFNSWSRTHISNKAECTSCVCFNLRQAPRFHQREYLGGIGSLRAEKCVDCTLGSGLSHPNNITFQLLIPCFDYNS